MNIEQAKQLAFTLGIPWQLQNGRLEKLIIDNKPQDDGAVQVNMDGGSGW